MFDTHAHLNFPQYEGRVDEIIKDCQKVGVSGIIVASSNLKDSQKAVELVKNHSGVLFASVGIHPQKTDPENKMTINEQLTILEKLIAVNRPFIKTIGETGLDFSPAPPGEESRSREEQKILFEGQIALAQKFNLPLIVHARKSVDEVIEILNSRLQPNTPPPRGVFHCYAGGKKRIQKILNLPGEWYFGFDGNLTYDEGLQQIIKILPEDKILIETDSPFLTPAPHRGEINTPAYLPLIQEKINEILEKNLKKKIEENSRKLFRI